MKECDLVMRGGITSGLVYPKAIISLSKEYRFRQIGGTSAGAIAAAFAAAAEANRDDGGFERLNVVAEALGEDDVFPLFQPHYKHKKLFTRIGELMKKGKKPGLWFIFRNSLLILKAKRAVTETHFGVCPGTTTERDGTHGLVDWMNRRLEYLSGRMESLDGELPKDPLTFGHLREKRVVLKLVATNISQQIPANMPIGSGYMLKKSDLSWILPENVHQWLLARSLSSIEEDSLANQDLVHLPYGDDMPVLLAVRMSMSFPLLFMAIPVYSKDWSLRDPSSQCVKELETAKLNYFLDGGLSSNFPIHYFDALLPTRPTFGINLTPYHRCRSGEDDADWQNRIYMPAGAGEGMTYGIHPVGGLFSYLLALFSSAKDWQDSVQMRLPGYRERIVHVALKPDEGGMNLHMPRDVVSRLINLGELAAKRILEGGGEGKPAFDFESHQWRRLLSASSAMEKAVRDFKDAYIGNEDAGDGAAGSVRDLLIRLEQNFDSSAFAALGYAPPNVDELSRLKARCDGLSQLVELLDQHKIHEKWNPPSPRVDAKLRSEEFAS